MAVKMSDFKLCDYYAIFIQHISAYTNMSDRALSAGGAAWYLRSNSK